MIKLSLERINAMKLVPGTCFYPMDDFRVFN